MLQIVPNHKFASIQTHIEFTEIILEWKQEVNFYDPTSILNYLLFFHHEFNSSIGLNIIRFYYQVKL